MKDFGVQLFGVHDKTALITGTAILLVAYACGVGVLALRSWRLALGGIALFAAVGVASALTRHDAGMFAALPSLVGAGLAVWALHWLLTLAGVAEPARSGPLPVRHPRADRGRRRRPAHRRLGRDRGRHDGSDRPGGVARAGAGTERGRGHGGRRRDRHGRGPMVG